MNYDLDQPEVGHVILEKIRFGIRQFVSANIFQTLTIEQLESFGESLGHKLGIEIRGFIWGRSHPHEPITYPRDWWQALKERFAPRWWTKRWPVIYTTISLDLKELYPNLAPLLPDSKFELYVRKNDSALDRQN